MTSLSLVYVLQRVIFENKTHFFSAIATERGSYKKIWAHAQVKVAYQVNQAETQQNQNEKGVLRERTMETTNSICQDFVNMIEKR